MVDSRQMTEQVCSFLDKIIDSHIDKENSLISLEMTSSDSFMNMVRTGWPGYGRNQDKYFYLDKINGCGSLRELVHYIMCYEGIYELILTPLQCSDAKYSFENYPEVEYTDAIQGVSEEAYEIMDEIENGCIFHVAHRLQALGRDDYALGEFLGRQR